MTIERREVFCVDLFQGLLVETRESWAPLVRIRPRLLCPVRRESMRPQVLVKAEDESVLSPKLMHVLGRAVYRTFAKLASLHGKQMLITEVGAATGEELAHKLDTLVQSVQSRRCPEKV